MRMSLNWLSNFINLDGLSEEDIINKIIKAGFEVDMTCHKCGGKGCSICKDTGWIEILGSGMVHPHVLEMAGIDSKKYTGFAFGVGLERIAMLKYGISDIRDLYTNDIRFLKDFKRF